MTRIAEEESCASKDDMWKQVRKGVDEEMRKKTEEVHRMILSTRESKGAIKILNERNI